MTLTSFPIATVDISDLLITGDTGPTGPAGSDGADGNDGSDGNDGAAGDDGEGLLSGTGSPEGVVSAAAGVMYRDTNGTLGAVVWTKMTGTGNTGWQVTMGDTGEQVLMRWNGGVISTNPFSATLDASRCEIDPAFAGGIFLRRVNSISYWWVKNLVSTANMNFGGENQLITFASWPTELHAFTSFLGDTPMGDSTRIALMPQSNFDRLMFLPRKDLVIGERIATFASEIASFPMFGRPWPTVLF